jgi:hypothetical protein
MLFLWGSCSSSVPLLLFLPDRRLRLEPGPGRHNDGLTGPGHVGLTVQGEVGRLKGSFAQRM